MIDKSKAEIAALKRLGIPYLLCIFHMLQDVERFCKSSKSGVHGKENEQVRMGIYRDLRGVQVSHIEKTMIIWQCYILLTCLLIVAWLHASHKFGSIFSCSANPSPVPMNLCLVSLDDAASQDT